MKTESLNIVVNDLETSKGKIDSDIDIDLSLRK